MREPRIRTEVLILIRDAERRSGTWMRSGDETEMWNRDTYSREAVAELQKPHNNSVLYILIQ